MTPSSSGGSDLLRAFLDAGIYNFDLEDLLRASAEVLGKGSVGTSYEAVLEEGTTVVVNLQTFTAMEILEMRNVKVSRFKQWSSLEEMRNV
ncbi:hypothetical protein Syun_023391 [Stephania yunnanensis]|uniref:Protein kinase domain-containing protein n=1 Tax=Stephania yunnanensis TaxID=152371 RepID=A0AAP0F8V0_9MAGN